MVPLLHLRRPAYSKKSEESNGVIGMMDTMVADLDKEMQEGELEEKDGQEDYEDMMKDAAEKRVLDSKSITEKEGRRLKRKPTSRRTDRSALPR